ncbi:MAG: hypothetical protein KDG58_19230, partial [Anaerolineae bacterium]|nr:hypothetical protein [Anaerolineae bacterium]
GCPALAALMSAWRSRGLRVELDLAASSPAALRERAAQRSIVRIVRCLGGDLVALEAEGAVRELSLDALAREADLWSV